jgi:hypothetical protein
MEKNYRDGFKAGWFDASLGVGPLGVSASSPLPGYASGYLTGWRERTYHNHGQTWEEALETAK